MWYWQRSGVPEELHSLLENLQEVCPLTEGCVPGKNLRFEKISGQGMISSVEFDGDGALIRYNTVAAAGRGVGSAAAGISGREETGFTMMGIMLDLSRNKVFTVENMQKIFRRLAAFGYNTVLLYCEDTYTLPGEPYFGYMRGRLSAEEVRRADDAAAAVGIELIACIQTLGHLEQMLRWRYGDSPYKEIRDTDNVMMVGHPRTAELVGKMLDFWSENLRSRRIHIGMDETHDLGRGRYLDHFGYKSGYELFNEQLTMLSAACRERGLQPMIWGDMYFRMGNKEQLYYCLDSRIPDEILADVPENVQMVYWDYYNPEQDFYEKFIQLHRDMGFEPIMGSGIWIWSKLWHDYGKALSSYRPCIAACRKKQVREIFFTMWEDDGAICHYDSAWTGIAKASDLCYDIDDDAVTAKRFNSILQADFQLNVAAAGLSGDIGTMHESGMTMFYDDPLMAIGWRNLQIIGGGQCEMLQEKYRNIVETLAGHRQENNAGNLDYAWNMANFLLKKITMFNVMLPAGKAGDMDTLRRVRDEMLPEVLAAFDTVMALFREQWLACAKPHGLDTIQRRAFGCRGRLEELGRRLTGLLNGEAESIPEWDEPLPDVEQRMILYRDSASSSTWF